MGLIVKMDTERKTREPVPADVHLARCYAVVDLGTQLTYWERKEKWVHKIFIQWELPNCRLEYEVDGCTHEGPCVIGARYTLSLDPKANLRKMLVSWRGVDFTEEELRGFDMRNILGVPCQLLVTHTKKDDKIYADVETVLKVGPGVNVPEVENPLIWFSMEEGLDRPDCMTNRYDWMWNIIMKSREMQNTARQLHELEELVEPPPPEPSVDPDSGEIIDDMPF